MDPSRTFVRGIVPLTKVLNGSKRRASLNFGDYRRELREAESSKHCAMSVIGRRQGFQLGVRLKQPLQEGFWGGNHLSSGGKLDAPEHVGRETAAPPERMVLGCSPRHATGECTMREPAPRVVSWAQIP